MPTARCLKPFVEIGNRCFFFSTNKAVSINRLNILCSLDSKEYLQPTYEFYRISYKGRDFSVPAMVSLVSVFPFTIHITTSHPISRSDRSLTGSVPVSRVNPSMRRLA